ncbi:hypothetical protein WA158_000426 [Blastocystis sp. Blastoise]
MTCFVEYQPNNIILVHDNEECLQSSPSVKRILIEELMFSSLKILNVNIHYQNHVYMDFVPFFSHITSEKPYLLYTFPVYYYLRSQKWHISSGHNTGTNFLLYPGDPDDYHALCTTYIIQETENKAMYSLIQRNNVSELIHSLIQDCCIEDCTVSQSSLFEEPYTLNNEDQFDIQLLNDLYKEQDSQLQSVSNSSPSFLFIQRIIRISESLHKPLLLLYSTSINIMKYKTKEDILIYLDSLSITGTFIEVYT